MVLCNRTQIVKNKCSFLDYKAQVNALQKLVIKLVFLK